GGCGQRRRSGNPGERGRDPAVVDQRPRADVAFVSHEVQDLGYVGIAALRQPALVAREHRPVGGTDAVGEHCGPGFRYDGSGILSSGQRLPSVPGATSVLAPPPCDRGYLQWHIAVGQIEDESAPDLAVIGDLPCELVDDLAVREDRVPSPLPLPGI